MPRKLSLPIPTISADHRDVILAAPIAPIEPKTTVPLDLNSPRRRASVVENVSSDRQRAIAYTRYLIPGEESKENDYGTTYKTYLLVDESEFGGAATKHGNQEAEVDTLPKTTRVAGTGIKSHVTGDSGADPTPAGAKMPDAESNATSTYTTTYTTYHIDSAGAVTTYKHCAITTHPGTASGTPIASN